MIKYILFILIFVSTNYSQQQGYFQISKNNQGGFNIYSNSGELLYKYTKRNTDSLSLSTLDDLFFTADSFVNDNPTKIEIVNIPEETWWDIYSPIISVLIGVIIGFLLSHFSQKRLINRQLKFTKNENWLRELIDIFSDFYGTAYHYRNMVIKVVKEIKSGKGMGETFISDEYLPLVSKLLEDSTKLTSHLNIKNNDEEPIVHSIEEYGNIISKVVKDDSDIEKIDEELQDFTNKIDEQYYQLITKRRNELIKG